MPSPGDLEPPAKERRRRYRRGHVAEWIAAVALMARGYRILGRRVRTPLGEIDLVAVRGRRIAFVEVKRRATLEQAQAALGGALPEHMRRAAEHWISRHARYRDHVRGLDAILVLPARFPVYLPNALSIAKPFNSAR